MSYTRQQCAIVTRRGLLLAGYVFPGGVAEKLRLFDGFRLAALWLDVELPISREEVDQAFALCDAYIRGKTGMYSAFWFFRNQGWLDVDWWADRPLWNMTNDQTAAIDDHFVAYGGWIRSAVEQFALDTSVGRVHQIDLNVAR